MQRRYIRVGLISLPVHVSTLRTSRAFLLSVPLSYSQIHIKKFFRYCALRHAMYERNTSGFHAKDLRNIGYGISYNTLRQELKYYQSEGWLRLYGGSIRFTQLRPKDAKRYRLFINNIDILQQQSSPAIYYSDLVKRNILHWEFYHQAQKDLERNCTNDRIRKKVLKHVRQGKTPLGARVGINCSITTVGRIFGKTRLTGFRYVQRMRATGIIQTEQNNVRVCDLKDWDCVRAKTDLYNRCFVIGDSVYERLTLDYIFKPLPHDKK
jgi:hypothetical protein